MQGLDKILGFEGYWINKNGEIYSTRLGTIYKMKPYFGKGRNNYAYYTFRRNGAYKKEYLHRLLAKQYIPNPDDKPCVNHKDGNKVNNSLINLEWCTVKENNNHALKTGLTVHQRGSVCHKSKLSESDVLDIIECLSEGFSHGEIAKFYSVTKPNIWAISVGRNWGHTTGVKYKHD